MFYTSKNYILHIRIQAYKRLEDPSNILHTATLASLYSDTQRYDTLPITTRHTTTNTPSKETMHMSLTCIALPRFTQIVIHHDNRSDHKGTHHNGKQSHKETHLGVLEKVHR
jgi:hypothetical protein